MVAANGVGRERESSGRRILRARARACGRPAAAATAAPSRLPSLLSRVSLPYNNPPLVILQRQHMPQQPVGRPVPARPPRPPAQARLQPYRRQQEAAAARQRKAVHKATSGQGADRLERRRARASRRSSTSSKPSNAPQTHTPIARPTRGQVRPARGRHGLHPPPRVRVQIGPTAASAACARGPAPPCACGHQSALVRRVVVSPLSNP